jgi:hypothetical protein
MLQQHVQLWPKMGKQATHARLDVSFCVLADMAAGKQEI